MFVCEFVWVFVNICMHVVGVQLCFEDVQVFCMMK